MLDKLTRNYNLRHMFKYELSISERDFEIKFKEHIDRELLIMLPNFLSEGKLLYGYIGYNEFEIKKRRGFLEIKQFNPKISGTYQFSNKSLVVEGRINGLRTLLAFTIITLIPIYTLFVVLALLGQLQDSGSSWFLSL